MPYHPFPSPIPIDNQEKIVTPICCQGQDLTKVCSWVKISIADEGTMLKHGQTPLIKGIKCKAGEKFDANIVLSDKAETSPLNLKKLRKIEMEN